MIFLNTPAYATVAHRRHCIRFQVFRLLLLGFAATLSQSMLAQTLVIPERMGIQQPSESLTQDVRAFYGRWEGGSAGLGLRAILVVETITSNEEATVFFGMQRATTDTYSSGNWVRGSARIEGKQLRVGLPNSQTIDFEFQSDGSLEMRGPGPLRIQLKKSPHNGVS